MKKEVFFVFALVIIVSYGFAEITFTPSIGFSNVNTVDAHATLATDKNDDAFSEAFERFKFKCFFPVTLGVGIGTVTKKGFTFTWGNYFSIWGIMSMDQTINNATLEKGLSYDFSNIVPGTVSSSGFPKNEIFGKKGFFYQTNFMFGYNFKPVDKMSLNLTAGINLGGGKFNIEFSTLGKLGDWKNYSQSTSVPRNTIALVLAGGTLQLDLQYYFTENMGISIGLFDTMGFIFITLFNPGLKVSYLEDNGSGGSNIKNEKLKNIVIAKSFANDLGLKIGPVIKIKN